MIRTELFVLRDERDRASKDLTSRLATFINDNTKIMLMDDLKEFRIYHGDEYRIYTVEEMMKFKEFLDRIF